LPDSSDTHLPDPKSEKSYVPKAILNLNSNHSSCPSVLKRTKFAAHSKLMKPAMQELPHTRTCFVCGESNPIGLKLRFETDGRLVQARFVPKIEHAGFRQTVHGGLLATVLDEIMVWACAVQTRRFAVCAELVVRFLKPVRPNQELQLTAELVDNRRGRIFVAEAQIRDSAGQVLATASGKYLPIQEAQAAELATDLVGEAEWLLGRGMGGADASAGG
jgi:uncharacterized protein (TIGR00369 family)